MVRSISWAGTVAFVLLVNTNICQAGPIRPYYYDRVVDENGPLYFTFRPEISDNGKIVFKAWERGQSGEAIYTGPNPATDAFVRVPHPEFETLRAYTVNDVGTVAFTGHFGGTQTTASKASAFDGPSLANNLVPNMPEHLYGIGSVSLNNSRQVAISATYKDGTTAVRGIVIAATGGNGRVVARATSSNGPYKSFGLVQMTNAGTVIYSVEKWAAAPPGGSAIEYQSAEGGETHRPVWDTLPSSAALFAANDNGQIVFDGYRLTGPNAVSTVALGDLAGGETSVIANEVGPYSDFSYVALNNAGTVAFQALLDGEAGGGIFTGPDPVKDAVVKAGDEMFGGRIQAVYFQREGLNNVGQVAVGYLLANNAGGGIAVATPATLGDADLDRGVNLADFNTLAAHFGQSGMSWAQADFTGDGNVNLDDFNALAANFGQSAAAGGPTPGDWAALGAAVPEPAALSLPACAALASLRRPRRPCGA